MANLGTLWFGADIDLTELRKKVESGNKSVLDALQMKYDPKSYQDMVSRLRSELAKEAFEIKITANAEQIRQNVANSLKGTGLEGVHRQIGEVQKNLKSQADLVDYLKMKLKEAQAEYAKMGGTQNYNRIQETRKELAREEYALSKVKREAAETARAYKSLSSAKGQASQAARQLTSDSVRLNSTLAGGVHISTSLGSALSSLFAVHYAREFLGNVIEIGGQLERQRISIGAILADTAKANYLFGQIKDLAVKSPFGVVELDQYTKQLSAYDFQYNELFDMTKRLADISAGAGQDIGRLTLALGHVRSATYLTGITLKQFSMNNIPMLKMLADYYTEVEKRAVSTAEVQKRISQRQVSYEDVIEQIRRLTDEGGMFYNMQEKISESLSAKYKNLKDAMDIMYGEMAESTMGDMLKGLAESLLTVTRHWQEITDVLLVAGAAFALNRVPILAQSLAMEGNSAATIRSILATKQQTAANLQVAASFRTLSAAEQHTIATSRMLTAQDVRQAMASGTLTRSQVLNAIAARRLNQEESALLVKMGLLSQAEVDAALKSNLLSLAWRRLSTSFKSFVGGIGKGGWLGIAATVGMELYASYSEYIDRIEQRTEEMKEKIKSSLTDLTKEQKKVKNEDKPTDETGLKGRVDEMKQVLANSEAYTKTLDEQLSKAGGLSEQYDILAGAIGNAAEKQKKALGMQDDIKDMIIATGEASVSLAHQYSTGIDWLDRFLRDDIFDDDIAENIKDLQESYTDLRKVIDGLYQYKDTLQGVIEKIIQSNETSETLRESLRNAPFEEQLRLLAESGYWGDIENAMKGVASKYGETEEDIAQYSKDIRKAVYGVGRSYAEIATDDIPKAMEAFAKGRFKDGEDMKKWAMTNQDEFKALLDGLLDALGEKSPEIRRQIKQMYFDFLTFGSVAAGKVSWWDKVKGFFGRFTIGYTTAKSYTEEQQKALKKILEEEEQATIKEDNGGGGSKNKGGSKKDTELEKVKTRLQEYKSFLSEYKKYRETYGKEKAISLLEKLFPNLKGQGTNIVDNYTAVLDKLRGSLALTTEARKKFANEIDKAKADTLFDREKEAIKENADAMKEYISRAKEQYKLFYELKKKSGGNVDFAMQAFEGGELWDATSRRLLNKFNERRKALGVDFMPPNWDMTEKEMKESFVSADGQVQTELVELYKEIAKIIKDNYKRFQIEVADAYQDSLTEADKLNALIKKREELVAKKTQDNDQSKEQRGRHDVLIRATDKAIAKQRWEAFRNTGDFTKIFSNLDNVSTTSLQHILDKLRELAPNITESVEATKALYEALDKVEDKLVSRNPFKGMSTAADNLKKLKSWAKYFDNDYGAIATKKMANYFGVAEGTFISKDTYNDAVKKENTRLINSLSELLSTMQESFNFLAERLDGFAGQLMGALGSMSGSVVSGLAGVQQGGFGGYAQAAMATISIIETGAKLLDDVSDSFAEGLSEANRLVDSVYSLKDAIREARQESETWFYDGGITKLRTDLEDNMDALDKYKAKAYEVQGAYKNKKSGLANTWTAVVGGIGGAIIGALEGALVGSFALGIGALAGAAAGAVVGAAVGTAAGVAVKKAADVIIPDGNNTKYAKDNLRVQTQHRTFFRSEKSQDLQSWIYDNMGETATKLGIDSLELFDSEGMINLELAKAVLDSGANLLGETRNTLEQLIAYKEEFDKYLEALHDYVKELYDPLLDNVVDAIWDSFEQGKDALDSFRDYAADTFKTIAKDLLKTLANDYIFSWGDGKDGQTTYADEVTTLYDKYLRGEISTAEEMNKEIAQLTARVEENITTFAPALEQVLESYNGALEKYAGISLDDMSSSEAQGSINGIKSISEDTANEIVGRLTAMQISVERGNLTLEGISQQIMEGVANMHSITEIETQNNEVLNDILEQSARANGFLSDIADYNKAMYRDFGQDIREIKETLNTKL